MFESDTIYVRYFIALSLLVCFTFGLFFTITLHFLYLSLLVSHCSCDQATSRLLSQTSGLKVRSLIQSSLSESETNVRNSAQQVASSVCHE